jgi:hypothetical protein
MSATVWHFLENQFDNSTKNSRKRMNIILTDHLAKVFARLSEHATITALVSPTQAVANTWTTRYTDWRNKLASYRGASQTMQNLLDALKLAPGPGQRSKIDEWDSKLTALWTPGSPEYVNFLPSGRAPFANGGRDNIIKEVGDFSQRLTAQITPLTTARDTLQGQVDAITAGGGTPPDALADALETAKDRVDTVTSLAGKTAQFHSQLSSARSAQQGKEGLVDSAATLLEESRVIAARRLYANLGLLMAHFVLLGNEQVDPQCAAGDFFDLDTLIQTAADEEPDPEPAPAPAPVTPPVP